MAAILPNPFALQSNKNSRCLDRTYSPTINKRGLLRFGLEDSKPRFRTENARKPGYVHVKCVANGKYLERAANQDGPPLMIVATAKTPNEDKRAEGCTLFQPLNVGPNTSTKVICRIVHVQSGLYLMPYDVQGEEAIFCAVNVVPDTDDEVDLFSAIGQK